MEIFDIERKEINFGCLEYGDVFEINGEILVKANVNLSVSKVVWRCQLKKAESF